MVKKMIVVLSAMALIMTMVGSAVAFMPNFGQTGDMVMIPMKVKTTFKKVTSRGAFSSFFMDGCEQYTGGFRPWGTWKATKCYMKTQVVPPKCVAPAGMGTPMGLGAPPNLAPGCKLISNVEKYGIKSPGCNPCVTGGMQYQLVKKQVVK
jgi:hypothetical protein